MKVLHVNDCAGVASNLVRGLRDIGVEAELIQPTLGTYRARTVVRLSLPLIRTLEAIRLRKYIKKRAFDIVHIHYASFAYMALVNRLPYVLHMHGSDLRVDLNRPGLKTLTRLGINKAKRVFYSTPDLKDKLVSMREDAIFLPNPIDLTKFVPNKTSVRNKPPRLLSISKLDKGKGVEQIMDAIEKILEAHPEIEIAIFNFGSERERARSFFYRHQNDPRVIALARVPHEEMPALINSATTVLGQQDQDIGSLGVSELEAMACAKPVICNFHRSKAYSSPPPILISRSSEEICEHVLRLVNDAAYCISIGQESRTWVSSQHELHSIARRLLNFYSEIL